MARGSCSRRARPPSATESPCRTTSRLRAYLAVKGVRDVTSGLFVFTLLGIRAVHPLGWLMLAACSIPIGDAVIVLTHGGSKARAFGVHGGTAVLMLVTAVLLLSSG